MMKRFNLIKTIKEYKKVIEQYRNKDYTINYENMVLNLIDILEA
jgi:hypothetical protein